MSASNTRTSVSTSPSDGQRSEAAPLRGAALREVGDRGLLGVQPAPGAAGFPNERGDGPNMERAKVATGSLQCDAGQGTGVLRGKILDLHEQHAERIQIALDLANGASTDLAMLRTEIDEDRQVLLQLLLVHR